MLLINMIHQFSFQNYKKLSFVRNSLMSKVMSPVHSETGNLKAALEQYFIYTIPEVVPSSCSTKKKRS